MPWVSVCDVSYVVFFETWLGVATTRPPLAPTYPTSGRYRGSAILRHFKSKSATANGSDDRHACVGPV